MQFRTNFLSRYLKEATTPLAVERSFECEILSKQKLDPPVLDIGCGDGLFAFILFEGKIEAGIDPNQQELKRAKKYGKYHELIQCYGNNIPKEKDSFNTIFSNSVLEHIPAIEPVIREAHRLLAKDGRFYVTVPTNLFDQYSIGYQILSLLRLHYLAEKYRTFFNKFWQHYHYYSEDKWGAIFEKNGFTVVASQQYCPKYICLLNDILVPLSLVNFVVKKILNRWFIFKSLRNITSRIPYYILKRWIKVEHDLYYGGIIFFSLKKN